MFSSSRCCRSPAARRTAGCASRRDRWQRASSHLTARLADKAGVPFQRASREEPPDVSRPNCSTHLADQLWQNRERSLILCGSQDVELQVLVNFLNHLLGNYGSTVDLARPSYQGESDDHGLQTLLQELQAGKVAALFIYQSNPVHDLPSGEAIAESLKKVPLIVSLAPRAGRNGRVGTLCLPRSPLSGDLERCRTSRRTGESGPTRHQPLANTRSVLESLAAWSGKPRAAYDLLREHWEKEIFPRQGTTARLSRLLGPHARTTDLRC